MKREILSGKRPRIDWLKAETLYIQNPTISYRGIAAETGVSYQSVAAQAKKGDWLAKREQYLNTRREAAARQAEKDGVKIVQETEKEIREVGQQLIAKVRRAIAKLPDEEAQKWAITQGPFREAAKVLMLLAGLPTIRSEVSDTRTGLEAVSEDELQKWYARLKAEAGDYPSEDVAEE